MTKQQYAAWIVEERNLLGNSIWSMHGFATEQEARAFAADRPSFVVIPAGEIRFALAAQQ